MTPQELVASSFQAELEKIALSKKLLTRAADLASGESTRIDAAIPELAAKGFNTMAHRGAAWRRSNQATRFLAKSVGSKTLPVMDGRVLENSAENLRAVKSIEGIPRFREVIERD